jgi:transcriptional regulator with XRE-family HTH domain
MRTYLSEIPKHPNNIGKVIKRHGWKLDQVAEKTNIPRRTLINYCQGKTSVPRDRLEELAKWLKYPTSYLVPSFPEVYLLQSEDEQAKGAQALLALQTHCQKHPTDENTLRELMVLLGMHGRYQEIEQCYARLLKELQQFTRRGPEPSTSDLFEQLRAQQSLAPENVRQASQTHQMISPETATPSQAASPLPQNDVPLPAIPSPPQTSSSARPLPLAYPPSLKRSTQDIIGREANA